MQEKLWAIILVVLLIFVGYTTHKIWTLGNNEKDYEIVCLGGHEYYWANFAAKGFLGIKLDDNGKPCQCK